MGADDRLTREDLAPTRGCLYGVIGGVLLWLAVAVILVLIVLSPLWTATPAR